ncbi:helicase-exonuclease AddAB subunit AddA [Clostridium fallax]|uniref:ATP-dependent helicase/nuclease subunit A n=1 Tax=Clostridium fallax TaxID=1533 RepID=A0A1M4W1V8_9CLOT|nr:helicase-exonuclease AddAB subunit AddA [Clostridium fallax]SHE75264.1 DNA helicase/exodeoxyribonuclease V, subunit A [Clostridium fallax]SQB22839.1 ATP-dependent nuclease subunit A [Clostridium fallax]
MAETKWTNEQLNAINVRGCNLLVAAAAGSGKTAVLVERIIKMITNKDNPIDIDKLLVVTFTNAAAAEMRERIGDAISRELEKDPTSIVLQRQLALLSRASITTIHSFCLDVIKNNFHHIDLDPNFRIGDDTECTLLKLEVIEELFEEKYEEDNEDFLRLVEAYGGGKDDKSLQDMILKLYNFSMSGPNPKKWLEERAEDFNINDLNDLSDTKWWNILSETITIELYGIVKLFEKAKDICISSDGLEPYIQNLDDDLIKINRIKEALSIGIEETYKAFSSIKFTTLKRIKKELIEREEDQNKVKKLRDEGKEKIKKLNNEIFSFTPEEMVDGIKKCYLPIKTLTDLVLYFKDLYDKKKRERGIIDFNDLEHLCIEILKDGEEPSKVALDFREKFEEVLVDEYQDSNNVQETIINLISRRNLKNPNVFMVGDVKQSIYRFRQAKPELFLDKYSKYSEEEYFDNRKIMLYKNFRSRKEVINGVNYIFTMLMSNIIGELDYTEKEALNLGANYKELSLENIYDIDSSINLDNVKIAGDIEVNILDKNESLSKEDQQSENNKEKVLDLNDGDNEEEDLTSIQLEGRIIARRIKELMGYSNEKKYLVYDKNINKYRNIRFKDIVILLRATKNWSEVLVEELALEGIPVYADTGTGYFQTIEIRTIMSLLQIIDNPMQDIHIISALRSPIFGFTSEELADLRLINKDQYFFNNIKEVVSNLDINTSHELRSKCDYFIECLERWREKSLYMAIDEFIWYLYSDTGYYGYVGAMPNGVQRQANLRILFQRAKQFEETSFKGVFNFINFISKLKNSSGDMGSAKILSENEDVVRIMSIHKSKGLEFPVVFLSGTGKNFNLMDLNNEILIHEELGFGPNCIDIHRRISYNTLARSAIKKKCKLETLSEEMRILYVAFTRAKEKLIITGAKANLEDTFSKWCSSAFLNKNNILPSEVSKCKSYLDWIGISLARHKDGQLIRDIANVDIFYSNDELSTWSLRIWSKNDFSVDKKQENVDKNKDDLFISKQVDEIDKEILKRLDFNYKFKGATILPSNVSVSDLKRANYDEDDNMLKIYKDEVIKKPKFLREEKGLSAAERGTAVHFVMQHLDLNNIDTIEEIKKQIQQMIEDELLTEEQSKAIYPPMIYKFFKSSLGKRMLKAFNDGKMIRRELPFFTEIPAVLVNEELPKDIYINEKIRLQGIIDCFFEEDDGIVLLDYKTDYVGEEGSNSLKEKYEIQIKYYSNTLEKILNKKVKEKYLYLFSNGEIVKY